MNTTIVRVKINFGVRRRVAALQSADMSDATTSHSTKQSKNDCQVAGYAHSLVSG